MRRVIENIQIFIAIFVVIGLIQWLPLHAQSAPESGSRPTTMQDLQKHFLKDTLSDHQRLASSDQQVATLASGQTTYRAFMHRTRIADRHDVYPSADVVSFSYQAEGENVAPVRPVIFMFNGGPGSSSIWLHQAAFGPDKTSADLLAGDGDDVPLERSENAGFLIDVADLVFVDPIGTGLSRVIEPGEETPFQDLRVDARAMCRFALNWLHGEGREDAPIYVIGVSYSTLRAAGMASHSNCRAFRKQLRGLIFVSGLLDLRMRHGQDVFGRVSLYPTLAAVAWQRGHVDHAQWPGGFESFLAAMENYADQVLGPAMAQEHRLTPAQRRNIKNELHDQLGLTRPNKTVSSIRAAIKSAQLKVDGLKKACAYDARFDCGRKFGSHPDLPLNTFGEHLKGELTQQLSDSMTYSLEKDDYFVMRDQRFRVNWDYRFLKSLEGGMGTNMADILLRRIWVPAPKVDAHETDVGNSQAQSTAQPTRIMVASGLYDLVTPYHAMKVALLRAGLEPSQFEMHLYEGGHMMYLERETGYQLAADIRSFVRATE